MNADGNRSKSNRLSLSAYITTFLILICSQIVFAQRETGSILGKVDLDGQLVPGVAVTVSSPSLIAGSSTAYTNAEGQYHFPELPPGTYEVKAELQGFQAVVHTNVRLFVGSSITVDLTLTVQATTTMEVSGESAAIDATTPAVSHTVPLEVIENLPKQTNTFGAYDLFTLTPGVEDLDYVAYGASAFTGTSYWIDGVDISNPACGCPYFIPNYNWIQEVNVVGIGSPAEYGEFTGVITNSVTRSGGNEFHGLIETFFQNNSLTGNNVGDTGLPQRSVKRFSDTTLQLGGPIIHDKLWFFAGFEYLDSKELPSNFFGARSDTQPKFLAKLTDKVNQNNTVQGFLEGQNYHALEFVGGYPLRLPEASPDEKNPTVAWNLTWTSLLSSNSLLDFRFGGFVSNDHYRPHHGQTPGHLEATTGVLSVNAPATALFDRSRAQANISFTHYADDFIKGHHDFKFGAEFQRSSAHSIFSYNGGVFYYDYMGEPFYRYGWDGYDFDSRLHRISSFAEDSWSVSDKLNLNVGIRWDHNRGSLAGEDAVFKTDPVAPRLGFTYDVRGDHRTVLKSQFGRYYEALFSSYFEDLGQIADFTVEVFDPAAGQFVPIVTIPRSSVSIDPNVKQTYVQEFTAGVDHEFPREIAFGAHYIYRMWKDLIEDVNTTGVYEGVPFTNPITGQVMTIFNQLNPGEDHFLITNPAVLFRRYDGFEMFANKRVSDKLYPSGSLVISRTRGNADNFDSSNNGKTSLLNDPNNNINIEGRLQNDPTVEIKLQGTYSLPRGFRSSAYFRHFTGDTWTPLVRIPDLNQGP